jgi:prophage tail gpP-like protein
MNTSFEKLINLVVNLFLDPHTKKKEEKRKYKKKRKKIVRRKQKKINKKRILEC